MCNFPHVYLLRSIVGSKSQWLWLTLMTTSNLPTNITFRDNASAMIVGKDTISLDNGKTKKHNVLYVEGLKHNLPSLRKMCDQGYNLTFHSKGCDIRKVGSGILVANANKTPSNVYILNEVKGDKCCMGQVDESCLLHRRMGHINFDNLVKLNKTQVVKDMLRISKPTDTICKPCQLGKQKRVSFKTKEYSTSNPLELVHTDLYESTRTQTLR
jgi:hypothetical protein